METFRTIFFFHQKRARRLFKKDLRSLHYFFKNTLLVRWKDVYKKNTWKIFQYFDLFETFRTAIFFCFSSKSCETSFKEKFQKLALVSKKNTPLVRWKDVYEKNTLKIFQYYALLETFRTFFHQKCVRCLLKKFKKLALFI